jgi:hypothetical protein
MVVTIAPDGETTATTRSGDGVIVQEPTVSVIADGTELHVTKLTLKTGRHTKAARLDVTGLWDGDGTPAKNSTITAVINGEPVFTGTVADPADNGDGSISVAAFDAVKQLSRYTVSTTFDLVSLEQIVETVASNAGVEVATVDPDYHPSIVTEYDNTSGVQVLDQVAKWGHVVWWVDAQNRLHVEPPDPTVYAISADFIATEPTAGESDQPYQRVVVTGESPASTQGRETAHQISKEPVRATAGFGEPVYSYESKQIRTQAQADAAAQAILEEFQRQRAHGTVTIVGEGAPLRPFDVIEMPPELDSERYLVSELTHTLSNQDGFVTDVGCGGLIDGEEA